MEKEEKVIEVIPRCPGCGRHAHFMVINKKTGETKYFCGVCATFHLYKYKGKGWEIIRI
jgi:ribosomal protein S27AE